jgi:shikimate dehydrogenase
MNVSAATQAMAASAPTQVQPQASNGGRRKLLVGLIGGGIQQSLTPGMHEEEARQQGLALHYQLIDLDVSKVGNEKLPTLIEAAKLMGFAGLNVTFPAKQAVISLLDEVADEARAMGAVNTVVIRDGRTIGHNTDASGWAWGFRRGMPDADLSRVVLLGAGGAGAAIAHAVLGMGAQHLVVVDREAAKACELAAGLATRYGEERVSHAVDPAHVVPSAKGIIHATPTGMLKLPGMPLNASLLRSDLWVSEIVYSPIETQLLKAARALGAKTVDGAGMAIGQAVGAFRLFTGLEPNPARLDAHFRHLLAQRGL